MYVCGPTVYDEPHIGHARSAFVFDVLRRYLAFKGFQVRFVRNVTDVDDKIIEKARQELAISSQQSAVSELKAKCAEVAERYLKSYHEAMDRLGLGRPDLEPKATEHVVPAMTDFIAKLLISGVAYEAGGDVYCAVRKCEGYGTLSGRSVDALQAGAPRQPSGGERPGPPGEPQAEAGKHDPLDFALWKAAKPGEPSWKSPWGEGRPGWHIECSAMSTKYLGEAFDLHGGGVDLVFPHHENEIAQAHAVGKPFARGWVHNGLLTVNGEKMSKSLGNYTTVDQVLERYPHPDYLKLLFLKTHYRSPLDYSDEKMNEARKNWQDFRGFFRIHDQIQTECSPKDMASAGVVPNFMTRFQEAMDEDLNTPKALAVLFDALSFGQKGIEQGGKEGFLWREHAYSSILEYGRVLGLFQQGLSEETPEVREKIQRAIAERDKLRNAKEFKKADEIRNRLKQEGFHLMDTSYGTFWRRIE
jgi:cysteinyl-tRNA synthetase